ncbi:GspH/FimT family pseudopilin [Photobacterium chitinilyticum]|uniref:Type II secretion system protein H n=1 Tax=Photobacterium chitinilyticum TaxID=2485123 RepID=A0A444JMC3_9GAMM|nr:GspH/FimT family pseudopilin [Photobacterium chitinilyticum]RWX54078.1 prepilin-type N-terminal cleavage/methylation domain-containing protein [Photobacterium chitinilyticum]
MRNWVSDQGFTLFELLVVISVTTILLTAAAPSFTSTLEHYKLRRLANQLTTNLHLARTEAIRINQTIYVHNVNMGSPTSTGWCVVMTATPTTPGGCSASDLTQALTVIDGSEFPSLSISNNKSNGYFDASRSIINQGMTYTITTNSMTSSQALIVKVSNKSRIRRCGLGGIVGFESC